MADDAHSVFNPLQLKHVQLLTDDSSASFLPDLAGSKDVETASVSISAASLAIFGWTLHPSRACLGARARGKKKSRTIGRFGD